MSATETEVVIEDRGPIARLVLKCQPGKITILEGRNGSGKSTAIDEVTSLCTGKRPTAEPRDGAGSGQTRGFGVTMKVGKSTRRTGELEVQSFDEKYHLWDVIEPPLKTPEAADAHRIKALLYLLQIEPDVDQFRRLLPTEEWDRVVLPGALDKGDLINAAGSIKRDIERAAREQESMRDKLAASVASAESSAKLLGDAELIDDAEVSRRMETAITERQRLASQVEQAQKDAAARQEMRAQLEKLFAVSLDVEALKRDHEQAHEYYETLLTHAKQAGERLAQIEEELKQARDAFNRSVDEKDLAENKLRELKRSLDRAIETDNRICALRRSIEGTAAIYPAQEAIDAAEQAVADARALQERQTMARARQKQLDQARALRDTHRMHAAKAADLRKAAASVDSTLTGILTQSTDLFQIRDGRLFAEHPKRGWILFEAFSKGEAARIVMHALKPCLAGSVLAIPQEIWEGLDPVAKEELAGIVEETGATVIAARATDGELRAEYFEGD